MKPEIKKRWVEALRSGKYKQGKKRLRRGRRSFCCLGVLCDIVKDELGLEWETKGLYNDDINLPTEVKEYCELSSISPTIKRTINYNSANDTNQIVYDFIPLAYLNDTIGLDFNQIADLIEEYL